MLTYILCARDGSSAAAVIDEPESSQRDGRSAKVRAAARPTWVRAKVRVRFLVMVRGPTYGCVVQECWFFC